MVQGRVQGSTVAQPPLTVVAEGHLAATQRTGRGSYVGCIAGALRSPLPHTITTDPHASMTMDGSAPGPSVGRLSTRNDAQQRDVTPTDEGYFRWSALFMGL
jgi:hypothetical protein